ncbi:hypothetical protein R4Z09_24075 [Niallia oryzisoli]|uniref:Uncharacterized protein n=1 Tax=Niallia oryzisoli TaxID=1737571 RepID=A0ABZ2CB84_9BACI
MLIKPLTESTKLKMLRSLNTRMDLSLSEKQYYTNLEKGYHGEKKCEAMLLEKQLSDLIISDLLLEKIILLFKLIQHLFHKGRFTSLK